MSLNDTISAYSTYLLKLLITYDDGSLRGILMNDNKASTQKHGLDQFELPERISYLRERRHLTQSELAKLAGVSQSTIAHIEKGMKDPSLSTLKKIAGALDVHIAILFSSDTVHVFDMKRLKLKYNNVEKLNPTLYFAIGKVVQYAKEIGFLK
jgi:transcriptional regulator with XRE-family HTH domain